MKSEHRHELQTNDLSKVLERTKPFLETYGAQLLMAIAGAIVVTIGYFVWSNSSQSRRAAGWTELAAANSAEDFDAVAEDFPGTKVAYWAKLRSAESHLQSGIPQAFSNRAGALDSLNQAKSRYQELVDGSGVPLEVRERALYGLARTLESLSDGQVQPAIDAYSKLVNEFPESVYRPASDARIAELKKGSAQEFYAWFHQQNPTPADRSRPRDIHGGQPGMQDLPIRLPEVPEALKSKSPASSTETPATLEGTSPPTTPAESDQAETKASPGSAEAKKPTGNPSEATPDSEKPDSEKPAAKSDAATSAPEASASSSAQTASSEKSE